MTRTQSEGLFPLTHTVEEGDTLYSIARAYYPSGTTDRHHFIEDSGDLWPRIAHKNHITDPESLEVGQRLVIPTPWLE